MPPDAPAAGGHSLASPQGASPKADPTSRDLWIYGLRVRSALALPDWPESDGAEPDLVIQRDVVAGPEWDGEPYTAQSAIEGGEFRLTVRGVGRYAARDGNLVRVDPDAGARGEDVRLYLTGVMMGIILHQRAAFPLHASCVALPGGAGVAFAGRSGAGKSTLVAALVQRGAAFVSDDLCVMAPPAAGRLRVWPGAPRLKLDQAGLVTSPLPASALEPAGGNRGKYHFPVEAGFDHTSPVWLDRVYLLADGDGPPRVERLVGLEAVSALVDQTYFLSYAHTLGLAPQVFRLATDLARSLPVMRLVRPRGLEYLPALADVIEQDSVAGDPVSRRSE